MTAKPLCPAWGGFQFVALAREPDDGGAGGFVREGFSTASRTVATEVRCAQFPFFSCARPETSLNNNFDSNCTAQCHKILPVFTSDIVQLIMIQFLVLVN